MLLQIPQVLDASALRQARELLSAAAWVDGRGTAGPQAAQAKRNQQLDPATPAAQALRGLVLKALDGHPLFFSAALPKRVLPPQFNRYEGDANHYGDHVDQAIRYGGEPGQRVRTDLSCTLFFSDPAGPARPGGDGRTHRDRVVGQHRAQVPALRRRLPVPAVPEGGVRPTRRDELVV